MTKKQEEYIKLLEKTLAILCDRGGYICSQFVVALMGPASLRNNRYIIKKSYPQFAEWITKVGKTFYPDYKFGDPWMEDKREEYDLEDVECKEDIADLTDHNCCPLISRDIKISLLTQYIKELKDE